MSLPHILLMLLESPMSGYELKGEFEAGAITFWPALPSQIYATLQKLEEQGLLTSSRASSSRGPNRRVYDRTDAGWAELEDWLRSGPQIGRERYTYIAQLCGIGLLDDPSVGAEFLVQLRHWFGERRDYLAGIEKELLDDATLDSLDNAAFFNWAALRMGLSGLDARIRCCTDLLDALKGRVLETSGPGKRHGQGRLPTNFKWSSNR